MTVRILVADHGGRLESEVACSDLDAVVVDLDGVADPADALRRLCSSVAVAVVALGTTDDPHSIRELLDAGASAYLRKDDGHRQLLAALRAAADGGTYLHPALQARLDLLDGRPDELTDRERGVLRLLAEGCTNREIAAELGHSLRTVELDRARLREKLGLSSRVELVRYARERGLGPRP